MSVPTRILDLHTHMFNARYLPLESIIADAMRKDPGRFAHAIARLLYFLTGSSYEPEVFRSLVVNARVEKSRQVGNGLHGPVHGESTYVDAIWSITERELIATTQSFDRMKAGPSAAQGILPGSEAAERLGSSELMCILRDLDAVDPTEEGMEDVPGAFTDRDEFSKSMEKGGVALFYGAERTVRHALARLSQWMDPMAWGRPTNYVEFFFTLLGSERRILERLHEGYGDGLPPMRFVHFMMDMQMAYPSLKPPYYAPYPEQMLRMQQLQRDSQGALLGFWAFDPRREDWQARAEAALAKGFLGFKFYPAMGYRPDGDLHYADRIEAFYVFCIERDVPIFAHCTPEGFQTRRKEGHFASPLYWERVLKRHPTLRLCLGHAGGGHGGEGEHCSHGWDAANHEQWTKPGNYARNVVLLCKGYPNVYCEVGHLVGMLEEDGPTRFLANLARANAEPGEYDFMTKLAYGTDWHMQAMVNATRRFLDGFIRMFESTELAGYKERFFWQNGHAYLRLPE